MLARVDLERRGGKLVGHVGAVDQQRHIDRIGAVGPHGGDYNRGHLRPHLVVPTRAVLRDGPGARATADTEARLSIAPSPVQPELLTVAVGRDAARLVVRLGFAGAADQHRADDDRAREAGDQAASIHQSP